MSSQNVKEIIENHLKANAYDGLCSDECGCVIGDLFPCGFEGVERCKPAYKWSIKQWNAKHDEEDRETDPDIEFILSEEKP